MKDLDAQVVQEMKYCTQVRSTVVYAELKLIGVNNMTDYDRILRDFTKAINQARAEHRFYKEKVEELDKATQDILHQLELGDNKERSKWTTKLVQVRKERRYAKDTTIALLPIANYAENSMPDVKKVERLLGDYRKEKSKLKDRKYSARVVKNLSICVEG